MHAKLGRCLVRLQQYELVMKAFAARHQVEGFATAIPEAMAAREERFADRTLGQVVGELVDSVFVAPDWESESHLPADAPVWLQHRFSINLPDDRRAAAKANLESLVKLRNDLVHGFIARHDIWTATGLASAIDHLDTAYAEIDQRFVELRGWYEQMAGMQQALGEMLATERGQEFVLFGPLLDLLEEAEHDLAEDGWTSLEEAIALIRSQEPELTPRSYGYSSWRHLLHDSKRFETRRDAARSGAGTTWYRSTSRP
jgi:hypothetical protein